MTKTNYNNINNLFAYGINNYMHSETREEEAIKAIRNKRNTNIYIEMTDCQSLSCTRISAYRWNVVIRTELPKGAIERTTEMDSYELEEWVRDYAAGPCTARVN